MMHTYRLLVTEENIEIDCKFGFGCKFVIIRRGISCEKTSSVAFEMLSGRRTGTEPYLKEELFKRYIL
jgi:hypothetical protein